MRTFTAILSCNSLIKNSTSWSLVKVSALGKSCTSTLPVYRNLESLTSLVQRNTRPNRKLHSSLNFSHVSDGLSQSNLRNHRASLSRWNDPNFLLVRCLLMVEEIFIECKPVQWVGQPIISRKVHSWVLWSPQKTFLSIFLLPVIVVMFLGTTVLFFIVEGSNRTGATLSESSLIRARSSRCCMPCSF